jgi:hypothetical protein
MRLFWIRIPLIVYPQPLFRQPKKRRGYRRKRGEREGGSGKRSRRLPKLWQYRPRKVGSLKVSKEAAKAIPVYPPLFDLQVIQTHFPSCLNNSERWLLLLLL